MHTFRRLMLAVVVVAGGIVVAATPAAAEEPRAGDPCTVSDLGKRWPQIESVSIEPTITHFTGFFVTQGTKGQRQVQLEVQNQVTVAVARERSITAKFNIQALFGVEATARRTVTKTTASTSVEREFITWNFEQPGYYGVYKGTRKIHGTFSSLNCHRITIPGGGTRLEWIKRAGGPYTTFTTMEEGVVRCEDQVPPNSIMHRAQEALGCFGAPAKKQSSDPGSAEPRDVGSVIAAVPPGFTCDPTRYRIGLGNGLYWHYPTRNTIELLPYDPRWAQNFTFLLCRGPGQGDLVEYALLTAAQLCVSIQDAAVNEDAATIDDVECRTVDDNQRWYVYRDAPNSNAIGLQVKRNGFMLGQNRVADFEALRHFSSGNEDGTGTYYLEPIP